MPTKFERKESQVLPLQTALTLNDYDRVTVAIKVIKVDEPEIVGEQLKNKQAVTVADESGL